MKRSTTLLHHSRFTALLCAVALGLVHAGCTQVYTVKVDAIRTPEIAPRRSYHLVSADPTRDASDPRFVEARAMVDRALELHGLMAASRPEWADMIIEIDYGISPRRLVTAPDPSARDASDASVYLPDRTGDSVGSSSGSLVPSTAFTRVVAVWEKHLSLVACENSTSAAAPHHAGPELWRIDVSVQDATPSVDALIPVFAAALVDSIDGQGSTQTTKRISERSAFGLVAQTGN